LRALIAIALGLIVAVAAPMPAAACVGGRLLPDGVGADEAADLVFTGTVVRRDDPFIPILGSSFDAIAWTFAVDEAVKGSPGERVRVESPSSDASCGIGFRLGGRYHVRAYASDGGTYEAIMGDATPMRPLADPPPTEAGGINLATEGSARVLVAIAAIVGLGAAAYVGLGRVPPHWRARPPAGSMD
jgi:hypothetical protein